MSRPAHSADSRGADHPGLTAWANELRNGTVVYRRTIDEIAAEFALNKEAPGIALDYGDVYMTGWQPVVLDLSPYRSRTIVLEISVGDVGTARTIRRCWWTGSRYARQRGRGAEGQTTAAPPRSAAHCPTAPLPNCPPAHAVLDAVSRGLDTQRLFVLPRTSGLSLVVQALPHW